MFIRFFSGEIDKDSHVGAGLFCAASDLRASDGLPDYECEALTELKDWFNTHLASPFDSNAKVQEGDAPAETPQQLIAEPESVYRVNCFEVMRGAASMGSIPK